MAGVAELCPLFAGGAGGENPLLCCGSQALSNAQEEEENQSCARGKVVIARPHRPRRPRDWICTPSPSYWSHLGPLKFQYLELGVFTLPGIFTLPGALGGRQRGPGTYRGHEETTWAGGNNRQAYRGAANSRYTLCTHNIFSYKAYYKFFSYKALTIALGGLGPAMHTSCARWANLRAPLQCCSCSDQQEYSDNNAITKRQAE